MGSSLRRAWIAGRERVGRSAEPEEDDVDIAAVVDKVNVHDLLPTLAANAHKKKV